MMMMMMMMRMMMRMIMNEAASYNMRVLPRKLLRN